MPYSPMVAKAVAHLPATPLGRARVIAPDHGPIWRQDVGRIITRYGEWAAQKPTLKAVIVYDTMWESTAAMAAAIAEGVQAAGARARLLHLGTQNRSVLATEVLEAGALIVGTPTINNQLFPTVADALAYLCGLRPKNLIGAAFGSHGWSGEGAAQVDQAMREMKIEMVAEPLRVKFVPGDEDRQRCRALGEQIGARLRELCGSDGVRQ